MQLHTFSGPAHLRTALLQRPACASVPRPVSSVSVADECAFLHAIYLERRKAERSGRPLLLVLLDGVGIADAVSRRAIFRPIVERLSACLRETDVLGWYKSNTIMGVLLPDLETGAPRLIRYLVSRITAVLQTAVGARVAAAVQISWHVFPNPTAPMDAAPEDALYPELRESSTAKRSQTVLKRILDCLVSLVAILLLLPVFALIALAIKSSSPGPVIFRQERLGQSGPFTLFKFRSMYAASDANIHREYVTNFVSGRGGRGQPFKMTDDARITPVGRILRKSSLDELPQLWNVLKGDMSLVGPRPPLRYEFDHYAAWHRRRVLEAKPGMTGLWQVSGRSRTTFNEMTRLDLQYARQQSLWLDLNILLRTPWAVLSCKGAY